MTQDTSRRIGASAPAKVLIAGGYLVLDRQYSGLVVSVNARFHTIISQKPHSSSDISGNVKSILIDVKSRQFLDGFWQFKVSPTNESETPQLNVELISESLNPFIQKTLQYVLLTISHEVDIFSQGSHLLIELEADNDFYSQAEALSSRNLSRTSKNLRSLPPRNALDTSISNVHKTGLGSSAALVVSLVSALMAFYGIIDPQRWNQDRIQRQDLVRLANLAHLCHCASQGKIGSGFDVSAAVFGSHRYTRFTPSLLNDLMNMEVLSPKIIHHHISSQKWDWVHEPFQLPPGLVLRLGDVNGGSNTPKMVSKVLQWTKDFPDQANPLWEALNTTNISIEQAFRELNKFYEQDSCAYSQALSVCSSKASADWSVIEQNESEASALVIRSLISVRNSSLESRKLLRKISLLASVPLEPPEQTELLDECMKLPGVLMTGVPGAGGYDAIFCVAIGNDAFFALEQLWLSYSKATVMPLLAEACEMGVQFS